MAASMIEIMGLSDCQPLFQEFCKVKGLRDGDFYRAIDYVIWVDGLTIENQFEIIRKYIPDFKMANCNL